MLDAISSALADLGINAQFTGFLARIFLFVTIVILCWVANTIAKRILLRIVASFAGRTRTQWDDTLVEKKTFHRLAHIVPAIVFYLMVPMLCAGYPYAETMLLRLTVGYTIFLGTLVIFSVLNSVVSISHQYEKTRDKPIKSYVQAVKIFVFLVAGIFILTTLLNRSPWIFVSGLGAMTAVLMLVFKDAILGFVASIQIATLDMVREGDWIEMSQYGADGDVIDVSLTTIKVQNWDKTITTIPTYALISSSFRNWRGMSESGGRRIKRSIQIDMATVRFCDSDMIEKFRQIKFLKPYVEAKEKELKEWNSSQGIDDSQPVNGRRMTNLGTFRAYLIAYLKHHPKIHQSLTFLVRQLPPSQNGIPVEVYVFSNDQVWANYEAIQADIFDHILAVLPEFGLAPFQLPSGRDVKELKLSA